MIKRTLFALALLPLAACSSTPAPTPAVSAAASPAATSYQDMSCAELKAAVSQQNSDAAWARRQQQQTFGGGATSNNNATVSFPLGGGGPSAGAPSNRSSQDRNAMRSAMAAKGCT